MNKIQNKERNYFSQAKSEYFFNNVPLEFFPKRCTSEESQMAQKLSQDSNIENPDDQGTVKYFILNISQPDSEI